MRSLLLFLLLSASLALADEAPRLTVEQLRPHVHAYFEGERWAGLPFGVAGAGALAGGILLATSGSELGRSAGWVNIGFGALELAAGLVLFLATPARLRSLDAQLTEDPAAFAAKEQARVTRIRTLFQPVLLGVWAAAGVAGGVVAGVGALRQDEVMLGLGLGLALQGLVFFLLDWAVLDRANAYAVPLGQFRP